MPLIAPPHPTSNRATYHHGDLRRALINAGIAILEETQRWDFSLREVARRAGVSHNAPYSHFADKRALLGAIAIAGYVTLKAKMAAAAAQAASPFDALRAIGSAYMRFGIENPAHYRLMFGQQLEMPSELQDDVKAAAEASRSVLRDIIIWGGQSGQFDIDENDPTSLPTAVLASWSVVHGFTLLAIDGLAQLETSLSLEELGARVAGRILQGVAKR